MTEAPITRAFADVEIRSDGTGRTIVGIVAPFNRTARVSDGGRPYMEAFDRGAFAKTILEQRRVKLLPHHNQRTNPLGVATKLREDAIGLYGEFKVSATAAGDEALELARDGALDSFSVGFTPVKERMEKGVVRRTEVALREVSLVTSPAYEDARISAVRARLEDDPELVAMIAAALDLRSATPEEPVELDTSPEAAQADEPPVGALRSADREPIQAPDLARHIRASEISRALSERF